MSELVIDNFACGGGASTGIEAALGRPVDIAINHNAKALAVHLANHPRTLHLQEDIRDLDPRQVGAGRPVGLGWFSPDCRFHSKARGGKPFRDRNRARRVRGLAWTVVRWAKERRPRVIMLENVEEFCFPAATAVLSKKGIVPISEIAVGDEVWTHNARWKPVLAVTSKNSETVSVSGYGNSIIETTPNHRFYAREYAPEITVSGKQGRHEARLLEPEWVRADKLADVDRSTTYSAQYSGYAWASPIKLPRYWMRLPDTLEIDTAASAFFYMIGRWLGDGWIRKRKSRQHLVRICANLAEADDLAQRLAKTGLIWRRESHGESVDVFDLCAESSKILIPWLTRNFGQFAHEKTFPAWIYGASEEQRWALVEGYCDSDGHEQESGCVAVSSVSRCLAVGFRLLLQSLGITASVSKTEAHMSPRPDGNGDMKCREAYSVSWRRDTQWEKGHRSDLHIWGRIRSVTAACTNAQVFDITVADDHSFIADGQVVHNCDWGPLLEDGRPDPARRGHTFRRWHRQLENLGYRVDMRELRACDYGAPTSRRRLFVIARADGAEIVFPEASHGPWTGALPYRTAAECIDWSIPCPSIFGRRRPLAEATLRRIARGVMRYVVESAQPFIVPLTHHGERRLHPLDEPVPTITAAHRGELALISPSLINTRNGERQGQDPRVRDILRPYPTITAQGSRGALVAAFLARHYGGHENDGHPVTRPVSTITTQDHHHLVTSHILKLKGTCQDGQPVTEPLHTIQAQGTHYGEVRAFLTRYNGCSGPQDLRAPLGTLDTTDRYGLVTVRIAGESYAIVDIGMRMLTPRELARATSFCDSYILDPIYQGKPLSKTDQVWMIGNAVCPVVAEALVRANFVDQRQEVAA